jgi:hypothetical protein
VGFTTFVNSWLLVLLLFWIAMLGQPIYAGLLFGLFGLTRGLQPLISLLGSREEWNAPTMWLRNQVVALDAAIAGLLLTSLAFIVTHS